MTADALRARLARREVVVMPGVWDATSALVAERAGFRSLFVSGFAVSGALLGEPDVGHLSQIEMAETARRICRAVPTLSVVVDADTGYGNAMNVMRTVELWEEAGAAGMFLEDQVWPKKCGHMPNKQVVSTDDWLAKVRAAIDHRADLVVTARTDARGALGLDEAIERGKRARDLGVDAVFIEAPASEDELDTIARELPDVVLVANMAEKGGIAHLSAADLADRGFRLLVSPVGLLFAAVDAMTAAASTLASTGSLGAVRPGRFDEFTNLVGLPEHQTTEERYR